MHEACKSRVQQSVQEKDKTTPRSFRTFFNDRVTKLLSTGGICVGWCTSRMQVIRTASLCLEAASRAAGLVASVSRMAVFSPYLKP